MNSKNARDVPENNGSDTRRQDAKTTVSKTIEENLNAQISIFKSRARRLNMYASLILWLIILPSIGGAIYVFIEAGAVTGSDLASAEVARLGTLTEEKYMLEARIQTFKLQLEDLGGRISQEDEFKRSAIERSLAEYSARLKYLDSILARTFIEAEDNIPTLLQVNITRFGTAGVIAFAVALLMGIYRYNMRLSVFYRARADALNLLFLNEKAKLLQALFDSVTPSADFGKSPKSPTEHLADIAKKLYPR